MSTTMPPRQSDAQRAAALAWANEVRVYRSALRRDLAARRIDWRDVLTTKDPRTSGMRVALVLTSFHRIGPVRCERMMSDAGIPRSRTIGALSIAARVRLFAAAEQFPSLAAEQFPSR